MNYSKTIQHVITKFHKFLVCLLLTILFASCSNRNIIINPITGEKVLVAQKDFEGNWYDAKKRCESLGDGWRLPTIEELEIMFQNKDKLEINTNSSCWSSGCEYFSSTFNTKDYEYIEISTMKYKNNIEINILEYPNESYFKEGVDGVEEAINCHVCPVKTLK